jgi:hypothetical protein
MPDAPTRSVYRFDITLTLLLAAAAMIPDENGVVGVFLKTLFMFGALIYPTLHFADWVTRKLHAVKCLNLICLFVLMMLSGLYCWHKWPSGIHVDASFVDVHKRYELALGKPEANAMDVHGDASQGTFKTATHIWTSVAAYVLWDNGKWEPLIESLAPPESKWHDYKWLQTYFSMEKPPQGSMAYAWDKDPDHWKNIGEMVWQCGAIHHVIYQDFKGGRIIGIFRGDDIVTNDTGAIFILLNDGTWKREFVKTVPGVTQVPDINSSQCGLDITQRVQTAP